LQALATSLSKSEARRLVSRINAESAQVRALVLKLHDGEGWRVLGYESWKECVEAEFVFSRQHAYRLLEAAQVERRLPPAGDTRLLPERHVRELSTVPPERQAEVYEEALKSAPKGRVTADHIRSTVERLGLAPNRWGKRATASNALDYDEAEQRLTPHQFIYLYLKCKPSIPARVRFRAIDEARYMSSRELSRAIGEMLGDEEVEQ
jgi:hypothetical protein